MPGSWLVRGSRPESITAGLGLRLPPRVLRLCRQGPGLRGVRTLTIFLVLRQLCAPCPEAQATTVASLRILSSRCAPNRSWHFTKHPAEGSRHSPGEMGFQLCGCPWSPPLRRQNTRDPSFHLPIFLSEVSGRLLQLGMSPLPLWEEKRLLEKGRTPLALASGGPRSDAH